MQVFFLVFRCIWRIAWYLQRTHLLWGCIERAIFFSYPSSPAHTRLGALWSPAHMRLGVLWSPAHTRLGVLWSPAHTRLGVLWSPAHTMLGVLWSPAHTRLGVLWSPAHTRLDVLWSSVHTRLGVLWSPAQTRLGVLWSPAHTRLGVLWSPASFYVRFFGQFCMMMIMRYCGAETSTCDLWTTVHPIIYTHYRLHSSSGHKNNFPRIYIKQFREYDGKRTTISDTQSRKNMPTMGEVDTSDIMIIIRCTTNMPYR